MMFRSLLFIAPLVSADEQTAMLQLNRRGEVAQHTVNDALIGSLEQSLLSKDAEKPSTSAKCTYYLKTVNGDLLLQKMSQLKGQEKTQQLLQRAMDSVGEQNLRSLEENLMNKDDDKKDEVKGPEKMSPCEVLTELRHAFKHHMDHYWEVEAMTRHTADKVGSLVEDAVKKNLEAALAVLHKDKTALAAAQAELKQIKLKPLIKDIQEHQKEEVKKSWEAIKNVIPKLEGTKMATTLNNTQTKMETAVKKYEDNAIGKIDAGVADLFTNFNLTAPMKTVDNKSVPAAGFTDAEVAQVFTDVKIHMATDQGKANEALGKGIEILKKYIDYFFAEEALLLWKEFALIWTDANVLATPPATLTKLDFLLTPPKDCEDDCFWEVASGYLDGNAHVEAICKSSSFDAAKAGDFKPRQVCDHSELKCADEMLYLAKKNSKDAKAECEKVKAKTIGKDLPNDTKLSDAKFKAISELSFMADHDGKTCEKWEKIKEACDSITA